MSTPTEVLRASVEAHNDAFETLLSLIPAKYYLVKEDGVVCHLPYFYWSPT